MTINMFPDSVRMVQPNTITQLDIDCLLPHPDNARIYGDRADDELVASVKDKGILEPLLIFESPLLPRDKAMLIAGHRRLDAARRAGLMQVPCKGLPSMAELDLVEVLIHTNKQRKKTNEQIGREAQMLLGVERQRAQERQTEGQKTGGKKRRGSSVESVPPSTEKGKARDKVGEALGISGKTAERSAAVVEKIEALEADGKADEAGQLRETLNKQGAGPAYARAKGRSARTTTGKDGKERPRKTRRFMEEARPVEQAKKLIRGMGEQDRAALLAWLDKDFVVECRARENGVDVPRKASIDGVEWEDAQRAFAEAALEAQRHLVDFITTRADAAVADAQERAEDTGEQTAAYCDAWEDAVRELATEAHVAVINPRELDEQTLWDLLTPRLENADAELGSAALHSLLEGVTLRCPVERPRPKKAATSSRTASQDTAGQQQPATGHRGKRK